MNKVILTGVKPTGTPHVGNLIGAIRPIITRAKIFDNSFMFIADYHALNAIKNAELLRQNSYEIAATFLTFGLDTEKTIFYRQSDVPEIFELSVILSSFTPKGLMNRAHAYKDFVQHNKSQGKNADEDINIGMFTYPILMASDILIFKTDAVPVGKDQIQHVEIARDIAQYFNQNFKKEIFKMPNVIVERNCDIIPGLDGRKMSKSYNNVIPLFAESNDLKKLIMKIVTNSQTPEEPKDPEDSLIVSLYKLFASDEEIIQMYEAFMLGGMGYGEAKKLLFESIDRTLGEPREKFKELMSNKNKIEEILQYGAEKARKAARNTLNEVRETIGVRRM